MKKDRLRKMKPIFINAVGSGERLLAILLDTRGAQSGKAVLSMENCQDRIPSTVSV